MIEITVDEKACVGCTLCVETCPTQVFAYNEAKSVPEVKKPAECFGCLSCSEICPATAIEHKGLQLSESHYHDPYALALAKKIAGETWHAPHVPTDKATRDKALADMGVRLLSVASVFKQTLGAGLPAVGTLAGRTLAGQLPRYVIPKSLEEALALTKEQFSPAWNMEPKLKGDQLTIEVKECFVRELCAKEKIELGGEICILFYNYLAGYIGRMGNAKLKLNSAERGAAKCTYDVKIY